MGKIKAYYVISYLTDVKGGYDTIEDAVKALNVEQANGGEAMIFKPVTWKTEITDITQPPKENRPL